MKKVAIIKTFDNFYNDYDVGALVKSITEWTEVDDKTFNVLKSKLGKGNYREYYLLEFVDASKFIPETVASILESIELEKELQEKRKQVAKNIRLEKLRKKKAKTEAEEKALFESLKNKFENVQP